MLFVGAISGAFGVRGEVRVKSFTAAPENICRYGPLFDERGAVVMTPRRWRAINDGLAITAPEIASREQAEALRGTKLFIPREALPRAEDDEYYAADLIGCRVENLEGKPLGEVTAVQDFGAGGVLEIALDGAIWRLPFTNENAPRVDVKARMILADPPEGLLPEEKS